MSPSIVQRRSRSVFHRNYYEHLHFGKLMFVACFCDKYSSDAFFLSHLLLFTVSICVPNDKKTKISHRSYSELDFPLAVFCSVVFVFVCLKIYISIQSPVMILGVVRIFLSFVFMCHQRLVTELYHTFSVHFHENHKNTLNYYRCHWNGLRLKTVYEVTLL